ncbi:hypothetical protein KOAAANKH_00117 [Brevundimonas sp. NIBR10]|uniref:hypothetical protein n=1 Tax=Brevundimonas sp. NIBR10 TaxID=3015997 RepID=UPI0022F1D520|nr:hypothetical protein [Brevundimonas sp. NIBR10]WGM45256.1 hypothetical protein KOAAANKH_00117 [Brevundimonas sp. NIBR10]
MSRLSEHQIGALSSSMSDASVGLMLGRSVGWVARMRRDLGAQGLTVAEPPVAVPAVATLPDVEAPEAVRRSASILTQGQLTAAIAAAARLRGVEPSDAYRRGPAARRVRFLAGAALRARFGQTTFVLADLLAISPQELAPSMLAKAGVTTDDLMTIAEALPVASPDDLAAARIVIQDRPSSAKAVAVPIAAAVVKPRSAVQADTLPVPVRAPAMPRKTRARPEPRVPSLPSGPGIIRVRPVSPRVTRWASWFMAAAWGVEEVADLFDVHPDALTDALRGNLVAA